MMEAELERYHSDPAWRAAYESALAFADQEGVSGRDMAVIQWAFGTANALIDGKAKAQAQRERDLDATRARIAAYETEQAAQAGAKDAPDQMQNALSAAVSALNARRLSTTSEAEKADPARPDRPGEATGREQGEAQASGDDPRAAFKRAAERLNAGR